tara:strand:+ start:3298 stop:4134 length:837 start_codon:yes stop_codon:yes gene_type:complete
MRREVAVFAGVHVLVCLCGELCAVEPRAGIALTTAVAGLWLYRGQHHTALPTVKYALVFAVCAAHYGGWHGAFFALTLANVAVMAAPPLYNRNWPATALMLALTLRTCTTGLTTAYLHAYVGAFAYYFAYSGPFRVGTLGGLYSLLPMLVRASSIPHAVSYRCAGMLVTIALSELLPGRTVFGVSAPLPTTPSRPPPLRPIYTELADGLHRLTDRARHPATHALAWGTAAALVWRAAPAGARPRAAAGRCRPAGARACAPGRARSRPGSPAAPPSRPA